MKLYIKDMLSLRCKLMVTEILKNLNIIPIDVAIGYIELSEPLDDSTKTTLNKQLNNIGLSLLNNKKSVLSEKIKNVIRAFFEHHSLEQQINFSDLLKEQLGYDYTYLANIFTETNGLSIQQFVIIYKIELVKTLLLNNEMNLTEIARKLNYSSVAHLSNQFKKTTGLSPTSYKKEILSKKHKE